MDYTKFGIKLVALTAGYFIFSSAVLALQLDKKRSSRS
jgi:hypothetical protein